MRAGENLAGAAELSILFCDDPFITELNRTYRRKNCPTDVLSFAQASQGASVQTRVLGDIVISLETVERQCAGERAAMRAEVKLLFCHGLLHLLGYTHDSAAERRTMIEKQALYLNITPGDAWLDDRPRKNTRQR
jgi:probable rRNA maturation factor